MSLIKLQGNPSGTGAFTIAAPNGNTDRTLTLPDATGTVVTADGSGNIATTSITPSSGIYLGGSGSANLLDDYEEGTYTATITPASGSVTLNTSFDTLAYTKIGRMVHVHGLLIPSSVSSPSGQINISLPFASANLTDRAGDSSGTANFFALRLVSGQSSMILLDSGGGNPTIAGGTQIYASICYSTT